MFEDLLRRWDGEHVVARFDEPSGTWMLICIHSVSYTHLTLPTTERV